MLLRSPRSSCPWGDTEIREKTMVQRPNQNRLLTLFVIPDESKLSDGTLVEMEHWNVISDLDLTRFVDDHHFDGYQSREYRKAMVR